MSCNNNNRGIDKGVQRMKNHLLIAVVFLAQGWLFGQSLINTAHLDHLYKERTVQGKSFGIIGIYSEYPDYKIVEDADEGWACVDDAARAAVFYLNHYRLTANEESFRKAKQLTRFLLFMQAPNGYFYNFIFSNDSVNSDFRTSLAEPNWWTWRAFFALSELFVPVRTNDPALADSMASAMNALIAKVSPLYNKEKTYKTIEGFSVPCWLPWEHASDQAAVIIKAAANHFKFSQDPRSLMLLKSMAEGILQMQLSDSSSHFDGLFLSWENSWHGWGNNQADALLDAYEITRDGRCLQAALKEIDNVHPYMIEQKYFSELNFKNINGSVKILASKSDGQIAYIMRPMIWASMHAYRITGKENYLTGAIKMCGWFFGGNIAKVKMYNPETGRTFDGINSPEKVNLNSGAESTVETLLALSVMELNPRAKQEMLNTYINK